jgi:hypothetical protein
MEEGVRSVDGWMLEFLNMIFFIFVSPDKSVLRHRRSEDGGGKDS